MFLLLTTTVTSAAYRINKSCKFCLYFKFLIEGNVRTAYLLSLFFTVCKRWYVCLALHRRAAELITHPRFLGAEVSFCHTYLQGNHMDFVTLITGSLFLICQKAGDLSSGKFRYLSIFPISLPEWNDLTGGTKVYGSTYSLFMMISDHQQWHLGYFIFESILQMYSRVQTRSTFYSVWHLECRNTINIFSVNSITSLASFCLLFILELKNLSSLFLTGSSGLGLNNILDSSMSNSFESHLFCLGGLVMRSTVFQLNNEGRYELALNSLDLENTMWNSTFLR